MGSLYLTSIYWAFSTITTVGYGDVVPVTHAEKSYALCVMYAGVATMSAITGAPPSIRRQPLGTCNLRRRRLPHAMRTRAWWIGL